MLIESKLYKFYKENTFNKFRTMKTAEDAILACLDGLTSSVLDILFQHVELRVIRNGWITGIVTTKRKYEKTPEKNKGITGRLHEEESDKEIDFLRMRKRIRNE